LRPSDSAAALIVAVIVAAGPPELIEPLPGAALSHG